MCYNQYLIGALQAVPITDIVKSSLSAADIIANLIIGTSLIISRGKPHVIGWYYYSCSDMQTDNLLKEIMQ